MSKWRGKLLLLVGSLLIGLLANELFLRFADPIGTRYLDEMRVVFKQIHSDTVTYYRLTPLTALKLRDWTVSVNADGMRGPALSPVKKEGVFRVLLLGDSLAFGWGVPWEQTVGNFLTSMLSKQRGAPVEVVVDAVSS